MFTVLQKVPRCFGFITFVILFQIIKEINLCTKNQSPIINDFNNL